VCLTISPGAVCNAGVSHRRWRGVARRRHRRGVGRVPVQRCTVHKHRNLLAHAPELSARGNHRRLQRYDLRGNKPEDRSATPRLSFVNGASNTVPLPTASRSRARLFSCTRLPPEQWKSARTTNSIERLHEEFKRRIKTQPVLPSPNRCNFVLGLACLRSDQHGAKSTAGKRSPQRPLLSQLTSPPDKLCSNSRSLRYANSHHIPDGTDS